MKKFILLILLLPSLVYAQQREKIETDSINVTGARQTERGTEITREDMERTEAADLWQALRYTPGVILSEGGSRGGSSFNIRGFDSSSIPTIVDGISVNSPFNGKGDSGSLLTGDLENIVVQKGYSSMLLGSGGMGGAILLSTSKPKKLFEVYVKNTTETDSIFKFASNSTVASIGTKQEKFYFKSTMQYRDVNHFRLSGKYEPVKGSVQGKGDRLFSEGDDFKGTFVAGITPVSGLDIWATYIRQNANKGMNPPSVSPVYSLWGWDYWKRESISLHGKYDKNNWDIRLLAFYDTYDNSLSEYSTFAHVEAGRPHTVSVYNEYAAGTRFNIGYNFTSEHTLRGAFSFRQDDHQGYRNEKDDIRVREDKISLGLEYEYKPLQNLRFIAGGGFDSLLPQDYWSRNDLFAGLMGTSSYNVTVKDRWLLAAQAGVFYEFIKDNELRLTYARRNQFPTMSDRYSTRFGEMLPNPNLKPEVADHAELGYKGSLFDMLFLDASLYYSFVNNKMVLIGVPDPYRPENTVDFMRNLDATSFYGFEFSASLFVYEYMELGVNMSVNEYIINKSAERIKTITYFPEFLANAYVKINPCRYFSFMPLVEYSSKRWADLDGIKSLDPYFLAHLYLTFNISENFKIDMSIKNIFDENYSLRDGYPLAGRTYSVSATLSF